MIDSILHPWEKVNWTKLNESSAPALLHHKFWVKGDFDELLIADEDTDKDEHPMVVDPGPAEFIEGSSRVIEVPAEVIEDPAEDDDQVDDDIDDDQVDDDVGPECHVLRIDVPSIGWSSIWVRKEYLRMYRHCVEHFEPGRHSQFMSPSLIVTGQPGIGEFFTF